ncbi:O-linked N-acetylglucosamine transferase, SPINDLY family protein [Stieleria varia]|uniref:protein O-GlcNAc transferase n=1 Tax=Stieleria varia TaxID=2528005 RepID=A0A5C6B2J4_9BACT|nr:tetratricopeptide repeat protein [Stieleria varia]TWU05751.1 Cellulose synthase operon protein C precursor [Stieleria varia]
MSKAKKKKRKVRRPAAGGVSSTGKCSVGQCSVGQCSVGQCSVEGALQLHRAGDLGGAKAIYCEVIQREPTNADAWHLLGMTLHAGGEDEQALECLAQADALVPGHPELLANLGWVYRSLGRYEPACDVLERAIKADPSSVPARCSLGAVFSELGQVDDAEQQYQAALAIDPGHCVALMNLGNLRQSQGRSRDAEQLYREVLSRNPGDSLVMMNLGEALRQQGKWDLAIEMLTGALRVNPMLVQAAVGLGRTLQAARRLAESESIFRQVIRQRGDYAKAYHYLGKTLLDAGDAEAAQAEIRHALELDPRDAFAVCTLGFVRLEMGQRDEAAECFSRAIELNPDLSEAAGTLLYLRSTDPGVEPAELFHQHCQWGQRYGEWPKVSIGERDMRADRRLKIGYVSPDFRNHAIASYIMPVMKSHDGECVEVYCYAEVASPDHVTEQLMRHADHWRFTNGLSDDQVAQQVVEDGIDILVDLAGHTSKNRLLVFARRPAPVQMTWLGYPNTTGLKAIDYRLTCQTQDPEGEETWHVEQLLRLPGGSFCFSVPENAPAVHPTPAMNAGHVTFGALHRPIKITDSVRDLWAAVMHAVPGSKLLVFNTRFTQSAASDLRDGLIARGVSAERMEIRSRYDGASYLETYHEIDIALDVFPWAGGTTTLEALWMGVPVLAMYGDRRSARSTAAIVENVGHGAWVARSTAQYVQLAAKLASDWNALQASRARLRTDVQSTIVDAKRFTASLENAYRDAWRLICADCFRTDPRKPFRANVL